MKILALMFSIQLFIGLSSFAQATEENIIIVKKTTVNEILEDSSEYHRMNKNYILTAQLFGAGPGLFLNTGLNLGTYLSRDRILSLEAAKSEYRFDGYFIKDFYSSRSVSLSIKNFTSNSFYFKLGLDLRRIEYTYTDSYYVGSTVRGMGNSKVVRSFQGDSLGASIIIGNQWQWENFTLGCDWIGIGMPFATNVTKQEVEGPSLVNDKQRLEEEIDRTIKGSYGHLLRFYLGASF